MRRHLRAVVALSVLLGFAHSAAWAKSVRIEWDAVAGATGYELSIKRQGKGGKARTHKAAAPEWQGDLDAGTYSYEIRVQDRFGRLSPWSAPQALAVMPEEKPELEAPAAGSVFAAYDAEAQVDVRWKAAPTVARHRVRVLRGKEVVREQTVAGEKLDALKLPPGEYTAEVAPVLQQGSREFVGGPEHSSRQGFKVESRPLGAPKLMGPTGLVEAPLPGKLAFVWEPVEGARAYELRLPGTRPIRVPASAAGEKGVAVTIKHPTAGQWQVVALTEAGRRGPASVSPIRVVAEADEIPEEGRSVQVSYGPEPYTYAVVSPSRSLEGSVASTATAVGLAVQWRLAPRWSVEAGIGESIFRIADTARDRKTLAASAVYRWSFGGGAWQLVPRAGIEAREYFVLGADFTSGSSGASTQDLESVRVEASGWMLGPSAGVEVRRRITDRWSVSVSGTGYRALASTGLPSGASREAGSLLGNARVELRTLHWISPRLGVSGSAAGERREVRYDAGAGSESASWASRVLMLGLWFRW